MKRARTVAREQSMSQKRKQRKIQIVMENATRDVIASQVQILAEAKEKLDAGVTPEELDLAYRLRFVRAKAEHRAGKCYLYNDVAPEVRNAIGSRIMVVKVEPREGFIEVLGWSPDYEPVAPGAVLPHYRWMYDTATFELTCVKESPEQPADRPFSSPLVSEREGPLTSETDHGLQQEDPASVDP